MTDLHAEVVKGESKSLRPHKYRTPQSPSFSIQLGGDTVQAKNGILHLTDAENDEMVALVRKGNRPDITQNVVPFNQGMKEAEELVRRDQAERMAEPAPKPQATRGPSNTANNTERSHLDHGAPIELPPGTSEPSPSQVNDIQQAQDSNALRAKLAAMNNQNK